MAVKLAASRGVVVPVACLLLVGAAACYWMNRGYGEVSPLTYEISKALYGACQTKSDQRLRKVDALIEGKMGSMLPDNERQWLEDIVAQARDGQWEVAARQARRMLEDQVNY